MVIQHLDPKHESRLNELLQPHTSMAVVEADHGAKVAPDHVYVIQPNTNVAIADGVLSVTPRPDDRRPHYPVDHFLRSLAAVQGPYAVGVILSGTGSDGTLGICEIKAAGGMTFAQDEQSAQHPACRRAPSPAARSTWCCRRDEIAARLAGCRQHPLSARRADDAEPERDREHAEDFQRVIAALRNSSGVDFSQYRDTTHQAPDGAAHDAARLHVAARVRAVAGARPRRGQALYRDVLINVTSFFRDPEMFEDLKREVFPAIVDGRPDGPPVRVWVPGCSTGQEAYSMAMALAGIPG